MSGHLFRWYPAVLLLILAALTLWLDQKVQSPPPPRDGSTRHDPDFIIENFSARRMNLDGTVRYSLEGRRMTHYPDDSSTLLDEPRFVHFDAKTAPVHVRSRRASLSRNGDDVYFYDDVNIVRDAYTGQEAMGLKTSFLHLIPDRDLALTDKAVTMTQGRNVVDAVGMEFDNRARILKLKSNVKVTYVSPISLPSARRK